MYDLHTHSLLSDGVLVPSEMAVRYAALGYKTIAITDHVDYSNIEQVAASIVRFTSHWPKKSAIRVLPGVELTHLPLEQFKPLVRLARSKGVKIVVGHGETLAEPVIKGTNRAAVSAGIDILAHPGLITDEDARLAKANGVFLEITSRRGHCLTNRHVAEMALKTGARMILDTDGHSPEDMLSIDDLAKIGIKAGLKRGEIEVIYRDVGKFLKRFK
ncbi:MAG: histidinol phosphate phosphatase domain-containing protein [Candidatus Omnitrophica bacterium]|nr:histidinol phosphate phosphatase domain-containing protein [Candidatus Omnitrophota bacterium]